MRELIREAKNNIEDQGVQFSKGQITDDNFWDRIINGNFMS